MATQESDITSSSHSLYAQVESYPWSSDRDFQSGLTAILGTNPALSPESQVEDLTLRARCFYFTRKYDVPVEFSEYKSWRTNQPASILSSLTGSVVTESPITPSSTRSPLWRDTGNLPSPQSPSERDTGSRSVNGYLDGETIISSTDETSGYEKVADVEGDAQHQTQAHPTYPSSFEEVMHLIQTGQPIPGIKEIPDTVLVGQGTEATRSERKKPWERAQVDSSPLHQPSGT